MWAVRKSYYFDTFAAFLLTDIGADYYLDLGTATQHIGSSTTDGLRAKFTIFFCDVIVTIC